MHQKQHTLWLLAAMAAPLAHFSGSGWLVSLLAALAVLPLSLLPKRWDTMGKPFAVVQIIFLGIVVGGLLSLSAQNWPSDNDLAVPLTILTLAALTGTASAPRIGAVLAICMALLAVPAGASGAARIRLDWLTPVHREWPWGLTLALLLSSLPPAERGQRRGAAYAGLLVVLLSALVQGTISPVIAASVPDPFYQTARTLGHMEPILAAGLTLGWYALTVWLLQSAASIAKNNKMEEIKAHVLLLGTAATILAFRVQLSATFLSLISMFLWVLIPFLTQMKKVKKR